MTDDFMPEVCAWALYMRDSLNASKGIIARFIMAHGGRPIVMYGHRFSLEEHDRPTVGSPAQRRKWREQAQKCGWLRGADLKITKVREEAAA